MLSASYEIETSLTTAHDIQSSNVPGGSLLAALLNRELMGLADRGGASGIVGERWADIAAAHASEFVERDAPIPGTTETHTIERVVRLDDDPRIARRASKQGLQNPDLLFFGIVDGRPTIQAVDAKFSIETARAKQVSVEMLEGLLTLGAFLDEVVGGIDPSAQLLPGLFISPESPVTRYVIRRGRGITKLTVDPGEVLLMDISSAEMFGAGEEVPLMQRLFAVDDHPADPLESVLSGLYYFRLARAAIAAWIDLKRPLLAFNDAVEPEIAAVEREIAARAPRSRSAWKLITAWIDEADAVNRQRAAIDRVAGLPIANRDLREWIEGEAKALSVVPPSMNQVRRRLGAWHRAELREHFGPIEPPRSDLGDILLQLGEFSRGLTPQLRPRTAQIVASLASSPSAEEADELVEA